MVSFVRSVVHWSGNRGKTNATMDLCEVSYMTVYTLQDQPEQLLSIHSDLWIKAEIC